MKKLPRTVSACGKCPYIELNYILVECFNTDIKCTLTDYGIHNLNEIDKHCPLEDVVQEDESTTK